MEKRLFAPNKTNIPNFDFASLYPSMMPLYDKTIFRREKIERLMEKINDKRINKE